MNREIITVDEVIAEMDNITNQFMYRPNTEETQAQLQNMMNNYFFSIRMRIGNKRAEKLFENVRQKLYRRDCISSCFSEYCNIHSSIRLYLCNKMYKYNIQNEKCGKKPAKTL